MHKIRLILFVLSKLKLIKFSECSRTSPGKMTSNSSKRKEIHSFLILLMTNSRFTSGRKTMKFITQIKTFSILKAVPTSTWRTIRETLVKK